MDYIMKKWQKIIIFIRVKHNGFFTRHQYKHIGFYRNIDTSVNQYVFIINLIYELIHSHYDSKAFLIRSAIWVASKPVWSNIYL